MCTSNVIQLGTHSHTQGEPGRQLLICYKTNIVSSYFPGIRVVTSVIEEGNKQS